ncbi:MULTISPECIES: hypothetical protein [Microbulbifer]|uniref:hypothetical protein n=1 Tax=Microbulbifer TaxID=48073 RepID=UPI001CD43AE6|nr:hypothetical protein [Microbulbifer agarilyticus]MCA0900063.1 hypothetical protein [Microbulbifer agarilyticus]
MPTADAATVFTQRCRLRRLETFVDVAYAVLFVNFIMYLPATEDMTWVEMPYGLLSLLVADPELLLRLVIAVGLTLINWNLTHKLLGPVERSDGLHTLLVLLQLVVVGLYLFFAVADPQLVSVSSPVGQSSCLAISGLIGLLGWKYACRKGFAHPELDARERRAVARRSTIEPLTAALTIGLAFIGPTVWELGWLIIPPLLIALWRTLGWK